MSRKLDKKTREALEFKRQLQKKQREEKRQKLREEKAKKEKEAKLEKARLDALKNLLEPTRDELRAAASDIHTYQSIVKLMFPKEGQCADMHIRTFIHKQTARPLLFHVARSDIVHTLDLSNMFLRDEVGLYIADCVKQNTSIKVLCLNNNLFTDATAKHLGEALKRNSTVRCLSLEANKRITKRKCSIGGKNANGDEATDDSGISTLAHSISCNKTIHTINMTHCNLEAKHGRLFASSIVNNKTLTSLDISLGNPNIEFVDLESMRKVVERNYKDVLKVEALEKEQYDMQEPDRHQRYLEIVKEKKLDAMKREVDERINKMVEQEEKKIRLEAQSKRSLQLAQMRDAEERERYRLRRIANAKDGGGKTKNGDSSKKGGSKKGRADKAKRKK